MDATSEFVSKVVDEYIKLMGNEQNLRKSFDEMDKDKSGFLERKEIRKLIIILSKGFADAKTEKAQREKDIDEIMETTDVNKDRKISFAEFVGFLRLTFAKQFKSAAGEGLPYFIQSLEKVRDNSTDPQKKKYAQEIITAISITK